MRTAAWRSVCRSTRPRHDVWQALSLLYLKWRARHSTAPAGAMSFGRTVRLARRVACIPRCHDAAAFCPTDIGDVIGGHLIRGYRGQLRREKQDRKWARRASRNGADIEVSHNSGYALIGGGHRNGSQRDHGTKRWRSVLARPRSIHIC
jgi:hypothetical protein